MKTRLIIAVVWVSGMFGAWAANWTVTDGCASVTADCALTESDQAAIDTLTSITITGGKCLYAASGNTVTIPCEIISTGMPILGKVGTGTLVVAGKMSIVGELKQCVIKYVEEKIGVALTVDGE
jgi:hypothetical protein